MALPLFHRMALGMNVLPVRVVLSFPLSALMGIGPGRADIGTYLCARARYRWNPLGLATRGRLYRRQSSCTPYRSTITSSHTDFIYRLASRYMLGNPKIK
ncbi:hypothetical protein M432DRAFT_668620 [Thermoascus aurantiacus ATCC 26904]